MSGGSICPNGERVVFQEVGSNYSVRSLKALYQNASYVLAFVSSDNLGENAEGDEIREIEAQMTDQEFFAPGYQKCLWSLSSVISFPRRNAEGDLQD
jgi:hypothetical protein